MDWSKTALVFPGQGSQVVGMGADFYQQSPVARAVFDEADELLGQKFSDLMFHDADALNDTYNTQPALYICSMAIFRLLEHELGSIQAGFLAGHSLGELTALTVGNVLTFTDGLKLVRERGRLMAEAGEKQAGAMAALLGVTIETARQICQEAQAQSGRVVVIANDNCPGQTVLSGELEAIDKAIELAGQYGAKRAVKLAVSVAAHSPLMASASAEFRTLLDQTPMQTPAVPIYGNVQALRLVDLAMIRHELDLQLTETVRWTESVEAMIQHGATTFVEIGAGDVLTGLIKRIDRTVERINVDKIEKIAQFLQ
jgi:[acyl-carrier-protein] S-malonyltransferase